MTIRIITNNVPRDVLFGYDLTDKERAEFNYDADDIGDMQFFRYRGEVYDLLDVLIPPYDGPLSEWEGILGDTAFSGVVVKYADEDCEKVIVGRAVVVDDFLSGVSS